MMQYQRFNPEDFEGKLISEYTCEERIRYNAYKAHMKKVLQIDEKYKNCFPCILFNTSQFMHST